MEAAAPAEHILALESEEGTALDSLVVVDICMLVVPLVQVVVEAWSVGL